MWLNPKITRRGTLKSPSPVMVDVEERSCVVGPKITRRGTLKNPSPIMVVPEGVPVGVYETQKENNQKSPKISKNIQKTPDKSQKITKNRKKFEKRSKKSKNI